MFSVAYKFVFRNGVRPLVLQPEVDILCCPLIIDQHGGIIIHWGKLKCCDRNLHIAILSTINPIWATQELQDIHCEQMVAKHLCLDFLTVAWLKIQDL
jgi:hypothetical protein